MWSEKEQEKNPLQLAEVCTFPAAPLALSGGVRVVQQTWIRPVWRSLGLLASDSAGAPAAGSHLQMTQTGGCGSANPVHAIKEQPVACSSLNQGQNPCQKKTKGRYT